MSQADQKPNLTQAERSALSKEKLITATIESLIKLGYRDTSTQVICQTAGLLKGGLFRQYPSRTALMVAAGAAIYTLLLEQFKTRIASLEQSPIGVEDAIELIQRNFHSPEYQAALELTLAARTDPELKNGLVPVIEHNTQAILALAKELFPNEATSHPRFDGLVHLLVMAFQGELLDSIIVDSPHLSAQRKALLIDLTLKELGSLQSSP